jgi:hypothetical protein
MACNEGGLCALAPGEPCQNDFACASLKCVGGKCAGL